jgi:myo-inositol 2-dehydrogenase / D-chiro-inositol 1-dehydrogenase
MKLKQTADSNMVAIMGSVSAYTGKEVTYEEMMNSDMKLRTGTYIMGDIGFIETAEVPVPGTLERIKGECSGTICPKIIK